MYNNTIKIFMMYDRFSVGCNGLLDCACDVDIRGAPETM
jgi:hypothetical protein